MRQPGNESWPRSRFPSGPCAAASTDRVMAPGWKAPADILPHAGLAVADCCPVPHGIAQNGSHQREAASRELPQHHKGGPCVWAPLGPDDLHLIHGTRGGEAWFFAGAHWPGQRDALQPSTLWLQ